VTLLVDIGCSSERAPHSVSYYNEISSVGHIGNMEGLLTTNINILSSTAPVGFAARPPSGLWPWTPLGDLRPSEPLIAHPLKKILRTPVIATSVIRERVIGNNINVQ